MNPHFMHRTFQIQVMAPRGTMKDKGGGTLHPRLNWRACEWYIYKECGVDLISSFQLINFIKISWGHNKAPQVNGDHERFIEEDHHVSHNFWF